MDDIIATPEDIRFAYRILLGREPDPTGLADFRRLIAERTISPVDLGISILESEEFAAVHRVRNEPNEVRLDGYSVYVRPDDTDIGASILKTRIYEPHVTAAVKELLSPGDTFVDVGANMGFFSALAAHIVGPAGKVVAVEPMDKNVQLIAATIWKNRFENIIIFPYAASADSRIVPLRTRAGSSNGEITLEDSEKPPSFFAQARPLDELLASNGRIDLIKFDVEGHELLAWRGFSRGLENCRPIVLTEFHPGCIRRNARYEPEEYLDALFEYGTHLEILQTESERIGCVSTSDVMKHWALADQSMGGRGIAHLDLLVYPHNAGQIKMTG